MDSSTTVYLHSDGIETNEIQRRFLRAFGYVKLRGGASIVDIVSLRYWSRQGDKRFGAQQREMLQRFDQGGCQCAANECTFRKPERK